MIVPHAARGGLLLSALVLSACSASLTETARITTTPAASTEPLARATDAEVREEAELFLAEYTRRWQPLRTAAVLAEWDANTRIIPGDTSAAARVRRSAEALTRFTGSVDVVARSRALLERRDALTPLQVRQVEAVLYTAAAHPQTAAALVRQRRLEEAAQAERFYGFGYTLGGEPVDPGVLEQTLRSSDSLAERLAAWNALMAVGPTLTDGLERLVGLRNGTVQTLGYDNLFAWRAADYDVPADTLLARLDAHVAAVRPLYRELHTWARHTLAARYGAAVPEQIPAHWLPDPWGQDWSALVPTDRARLDAELAAVAPGEIVRQADRFYQSMGFEPLPAAYYARSNNLPLPDDAPVQKNTTASAWHMDLDRDVRTLMSVASDAGGFEAAHRQIGRVHHFLALARPDLPPVLRTGANRAVHEAVAGLLADAARSPRGLDAAGIVEGVAERSGPADPIPDLLREALLHVPFVPFAARTVTGFEADLYVEGIPPDEWNARWWELAREAQGVVPPDPARAAFGSPFNDAATKAHVNDDPARYYDFALAALLQFQLREHIARNVLGEDPRTAVLAGRPEVGAFLREALGAGATLGSDAWTVRATGRPLSAQPMLDHFAPLLEWLRAENEGRTPTL